MDPTRTDEPAAKRLGLWDAVSLIVGIVIGAGIFETPPLIYSNVPSAAVGLALWVVVGLLCMAGALCYAELASTYPRTGGDYFYLGRAFGPLLGFLFGWAQLAVILPASIGMLAYVFGDYTVALWRRIDPAALAGAGDLDFGPLASTLFAALAIALLTLINVLGVVLGKGAQNVLTAAKVLGLAGVVAAGLAAPAAPADAAAGTAAIDWRALTFPLVLIFLTYGGWNDAAFVAAEVREPRRNIPRALIYGILAITALYLLINFAYLRSLGLAGVRRSEAVATDVVQHALAGSAWADWGGRAISILVMVSALGAVNGVIFVGARVYAGLGADYGAFAWLGRWNTRHGSPVAALVAQGAISLGLVALVGTPQGRALIDDVFARVGLADVRWEHRGRGGFGLLLQCTAPVFWLFFWLTSLSLFVLRDADRDLPRAFAVPLYPVVPLVFFATCSYMLYSGLNYAGVLGWVGTALLAVGVPLYCLPQARRSAAAPAAAPEKV